MAVFDRTKHPVSRNDYEIEIADDFPKKKEGNVRLKIIEERPAIRKIRTRYDPEITMYGDKNANKIPTR